MHDRELTVYRLHIWIGLHFILLPIRNHLLPLLDSLRLKSSTEFREEVLMLRPHYESLFKMLGKKLL